MPDALWHDRSWFPEQGWFGMSLRSQALLPLGALLAACAPYPEGLRATPEGSGPEVRVDWDHEPLPDIPFPIDLATRVDRTSPTGLRLNISEQAHTEREMELRRKFNQLTGFGVFAPISVAFEAPLDLDEVHERHRTEADWGPDRHADDAFFVIDVDPDSPDFGQPVDLDVGHGRYPLDVYQPDRYFDNDAHADSVSIAFDTVDEDLDGDGELDWGEDTDNDGYLDTPNVYPEGGDPRFDLMGWYERQTDTLMVRPVEPLREETTYAVVLTERLVGEEGEPIRSPWDFVNHTRQTEALLPVVDALAELGVGTEEIAFAWTFTTGRVTGDMVDAARGIRGEGPFADALAPWPGGVHTAARLNEFEDEGSSHEVPSEILVGLLLDLGLFSGDGAEVLGDNYLAFSDRFVGGQVDVPYLMGDRDGDDDSDESWELDPLTGDMVVENMTVSFDCAIPVETETVTAPFPVAIYGHGYGSSRFEAYTFGWGLNRVGIALCTFDYPGHGPTLSTEEESLVRAVLAAEKLEPFGDHLWNARHRDLDNDGRPDSGRDQWSADVFHTRDMVRQAALDTALLAQSFRDCGEGDMALPDGGTAPSCDWDGDGLPDIGGPDVPIFAVGGSLGGINLGVFAAIWPDHEGVMSHVGGAGLLDIGARTQISNAVEAMYGRIWGPFVVGYPTGTGGLEVHSYAVSSVSMRSQKLATLAAIPALGTVEVENLHTGEIVEGMIPGDGRFRVGIGADGLTPPEKSALLDMDPEVLLEGGTYEVDDTSVLGDPLVVRIYDAAGALVQEISEYEEDVEHEGVLLRAGQTVVSPTHGMGYIKSSPEARRAGSVFAAVVEPGDPAAYAPAYDKRPFEAIGGEPRNVLLVPSVGDPIVSFNTGVANARAAGWLERVEEDERYGMSVDRWLLERKVVHSIASADGYVCANDAACLFDPDDLDNGTDGSGAPSDDPLRVSVEHDSGTSGLRMAYISPTGTHGMGMPEPDEAFDHNTFHLMQTAWWFATQGQELRDDACLHDLTCDFLPPMPEER